VLASEDLRLLRLPEPPAQPLARAGAIAAGRRLAKTLCPSLAPALRARVVLCPAVALESPLAARGLDWAPVGAVLRGPDLALAAGAAAVARSFTSPPSTRTPPCRPRCARLLRLTPPRPKVTRPLG
jgi:hypothetical protein